MISGLYIIILISIVLLIIMCKENVKLQKDLEDKKEVIKVLNDIIIDFDKEK